MKLKYTLPKGLLYYPYMLEMIEENHTVIAGTTGSGKSVLENNIIYSLLCTHYPGKVENGKGCKFVLIDPKKVELDIYKSLPHTLLYADNINDIENALYYVRQLINKRLTEMKMNGWRKSKELPIYIFIDELVDIILSNRSKQIIDLIKDSISISRACNIFFVMLTQAPNRKILKPEIMLNCNCRVALYCNDSIESRQIINDNTACQLPFHGLGIVQQNIDRYMIKIPMITDKQIKEIVFHWNKQHSFIRKMFR